MEIRKSIVLISLLWSISQAHAESIQPFAIGNYNPLPQLFGLPLFTQPSLLHNDSQRIMLLYDKSNYYTFGMSSTEELVFDGESTRYTVVYDQRLKNDYQWGITIPLVKHDGGSLDTFIEDWHDWLGLPQSGRDKVPRNALQIYYKRNGVTEFNLLQPTSGIGDVRLHLSKQILEPSAYLGFMQVVSASLKLPTGDSASLRGSGNVDLSIWGSGSNKIQLFDFTGFRFHALGLSYNGKSDVLPQIQRRTVAFAQLGGGVRLSQDFIIKTQIDFHSAYFKDSQLSQLAAYAVQLTLGGSYHFTKTVKLDVSVSEDLYVDVSPDVTFHLGLDARY